MLLTITQQAKEQLDQIKNGYYLQLWYDTKGLGCGVNGMPTFRFVDEKESFHQDVDCETYPAIIASQQQTFFSQKVKLDFINGMFRLSSPEGILNPFISVSSIV
ncbi:iron-sulfur cluster biosynthesis family protein [Ornithinibacillus halophilus]|uniref:Uncharacterized protein YqkB n=1 Tax=Ornithinibacillus halophilus TaxID=930117 RepID=A0A1M5CV44_9BACI|nr:iron-sulfur cluster biosynthesis family protein [Ornithinibacillus halophilus]SHF58640.1 Uncharacterized protein YqkB [Ornithinibacillus halophilus]